MATKDNITEKGIRLEDSPVYKLGTDSIGVCIPALIKNTADVRVGDMTERFWDGKDTLTIKFKKGKNPKVRR